MHNFSISLDGYGAGPAQDLDQPLGVGGEQLHEWIFPDGRERTAVDEAFVARGVDGIGATIISSTASLRGPSRACERWGEGGPFSRRLRAHPSPAAGGGAVRLGGGAATVQEYVQAGLLDELHIAVVPVLLGCGERLFENLGDALGGWSCVEFAPSTAVAHVRLRRQ